MFLGFANFYRRLFRNFSRIVALLTSMLQTTNDETLSTCAIKNKKNQDIPSSTTEAGSSAVSRSIKNLSTITKSTRFKKSDLPKVKFAKVKSKTDFFISKVKKAFIYL